MSLERYWEDEFNGVDLTEDVQKTIKNTIAFREVLAHRNDPTTSYIPMRRKRHT
jgi:hypothetical protein